jgi:hypothetical protein
MLRIGRGVQNTFGGACRFKPLIHSKGIAYETCILQLRKCMKSQTLLPPDYGRKSR